MPGTASLPLYLHLPTEFMTIIIITTITFVLTDKVKSSIVTCQAAF